MVTTRDDGLVRTHDEARALLSYSAGGALVEIASVRGHDRDTCDARDATRRYQVTVPGAAPVVALYSLPARAADLARDVREAAASAFASRSLTLTLTSEAA